jgi:hypothetical protein
VAADEVLTVFAKERYDEESKRGIPEKDRFHGISLRPGTLTSEKAGGVLMGKITSRGNVSRATVAEAVVAVLETEGSRGWIDFLDGDEDVSTAVKRLVKEEIDSVDGEDFEDMRERATKL